MHVRIAFNSVHDPTVFQKKTQRMHNNGIIYPRYGWRLAVISCKLLCCKRSITWMFQCDVCYCYFNPRLFRITHSMCTYYTHVCAFFIGFCHFTARLLKKKHEIKVKYEEERRKKTHKCNRIESHRNKERNAMQIAFFLYSFILYRKVCDI